MFDHIISDFYRFTYSICTVAGYKLGYMQNMNEAGRGCQFGCGHYDTQLYDTQLFELGVWFAQ